MCRCIFTRSRFLRYPDLSFKNNPDTVRHLKVTTVHIPVFLMLDFLFNVSVSLPLLIIGIQSCKYYHTSRHVSSTYHASHPIALEDRGGFIMV